MGTGLLPEYKRVSNGIQTQEEERAPTPGNTNSMTTVHSLQYSFSTHYYPTTFLIITRIGEDLMGKVSKEGTMD